MGLSLGSLRPNRFIIKPTSAGPIIRTDCHIMIAITNARSAVIPENTVGVIKPFFLQCSDIEAGATMQAGRGKEAQKNIQRTRIRTTPERQNAGTKLVFNAARARENWLLFGLIFYECRGYCPARRPGVKVKAA